MKKCLKVIITAVIIMITSYVMKLRIMESYRTSQDDEMQVILDKYYEKNYTESFKERDLSNLASLNQDLETHPDDKGLIQRIQKIITPPSEMEYNLSDPKADPSAGQSRQIRKILGNLRGGFFVECGAWDGEKRSNTLKFERDLGWKGLLIEADLVNYETLLEKNRKAWSINRCLSLKSHPTKVIFNQAMSVGRISNITRGDLLPWQSDVECLPFYSLMLALNITTIDYFSIDVEGDELPILSTIPWDKLNIRTMSVESFQRKISKQIIKYLNTKGYKLYITFLHPNGSDQDLIFYRNDIIPRLPATSIKWRKGPQNSKCRKRTFSQSEELLS